MSKLPYIKYELNNARLHNGKIIVRENGKEVAYRKVFMNGSDKPFFVRTR